MSETIEDLIADAVVAEFEKLPAVHEVVINAHGVGEIVVRALREAGLLVEGGNFEYASRDTEDGTIVIPPSGKPIRSWYFEDVRRVVGPWVAVDSGEDEK